MQGQAAAVLVTNNDLHIWDVDTQQKLYHWHWVPDKAQDSTSALFFRGVASVHADDNSSLLCVGSSSGVVHTFAVGVGTCLQHSYDLLHHSHPIASLASGDASSNYLASCDDHGAVTVCQAKSAGNFHAKHTWEGHGVPCVSTVIKGVTLIVAFYDGSVRLYSLVWLMDKLCLPYWCTESIWL